MIGFWFLEVSSLLFVYMLFNFFFSGHMFPIDMLDKVNLFGLVSLGTIVRLLPLQYLAYFPCAVFLGKITGPDLAWGLVIEVAWVVFFIVTLPLVVQPRRAALFSLRRLTMQSNYQIHSRLLLPRLSHLRPQ